jgi:hypothetical protein
MERREIVIDTEEMGEYILEQLINQGYVPTDKEINALTDIVFDYLLSKSIIEEM